MGFPEKLAFRLYLLEQRLILKLLNRVVRARTPFPGGSEVFRELEARHRAVGQPAAVILPGVGRPDPIVGVLVAERGIHLGECFLALAPAEACRLLLQPQGGRQIGFDQFFKPKRSN